MESFEWRHGPAALLEDDCGEGLDEPTSVAQVMKDFQMSRRASVMGTAKRKVSPIMQRLHFDESAAIGDLSEAASPLHASTRKVPRLGDLGPDPLEGLASVRAAQRHARVTASAVSEEEQKLRKELDEAKAEARKSASEAVAARAKVTQWEALHAKLETGRTQARLEKEAAEERLRTQTERWKKEKEALEFQLSQKRCGIEEELREGQRLQEERRDMRNSLESQNNGLLSENARLQQEAHEAKREAEAAESGAAEAAERFRFRIQELESRLREEEAKQNARESASEGRLELQQQLEEAQLRLQKAEHEVGRLEGELQQNEDAVIQRKAMSQQLARYPQMVKDLDALRLENSLLKETAENVELLKERVASLEKELASASAQAETGRRAQSDLEVSRRAVEQWEQAVLRLLSAEEAAAVGAAVGPAVMEQKVAEWQRKELVLTQEVEELKARSAKRCHIVYGDE